MLVLRAVSLAWMAFEAKKYQFQSMKFTIDDLFLRQEERNALYEVFDHAAEVSTCWRSIFEWA
jgi:hypothetical protein